MSIKPKQLDRIKTALVIVFFIFVSLLFIIPFYWMLVSSFKPTGEIFTDSLSLLPKNPIISSYTNLLGTHFLRWYLNTMIFAVGYVILGLFVCSLAGFAFAKYKFKFRNLIFIVIVAAQMLPIHMQLIPLFIMLSEFHKNTP